MTLANFVWQRVRQLNHLPGAYAAFYFLMNRLFRDGSTITIRRGPARGYLWRHHQGHQPWMPLGLYEPQVARLIATSLQPGDIFFDIGANAGYFTLIAARAVEETGHVTAFEPVPHNARTIRTQIELNGLQSICRVEEIAIADQTGQAPLQVPARNANAHLANVDAPHIQGTPSSTTVTIQCSTLDDYLSCGTPSPTLVKIDIEGAEVLALNGARTLMQSSAAPTFLITAHSKELKEQVTSILTETGYTISPFTHMIHALPPHHHV